MQETSQYLLEKKDMTNPGLVPEWLVKEYKTFHNLVTDRTFPCYFGMGAENKGELRYSYLPHNGARDLAAG